MLHIRRWLPSHTLAAASFSARAFSLRLALHSGMTRPGVQGVWQTAVSVHGQGEHVDGHDAKRSGRRSLNPFLCPVKDGYETDRKPMSLLARSDIRTIGRRGFRTKSLLSCYRKGVKQHLDHVVEPLWCAISSSLGLLAADHSGCGCLAGPKRQTQYSSSVTCRAPGRTLCM